MVSKINALKVHNLNQGHGGLPKGYPPPEGGPISEREASFENRRLAKEAAFKKAIHALVDVKHVGHDYLNETERDLVGFVRVMLLRKLY
jgi:hypothetical protein